MNPIHNAEAERQVLGSILVDPSLMGVIDLEADEFYIHRNQFVWQAFQSLIKSKSEIDFTTVINELDKNGEVKIDYLYEITADIPSALHAESYADIVREKAIRRKTVYDANKLVNLAYDETNDIAEERANVAVELASTRGQSGAVHFNKWLSDGFDLLEEWSHNPREHAGLSTGLGDLDKVFGDGLLPGLNLLIGEPGLGKSILAQQIGLNFVKENIPGVFYAGEMDWKNMYLRFMSSLSSQKVSDMMRGVTNFTSVSQAMEELEKKVFFVDDPKGMKTPELRADLIRLKAEHNIQWMVFDYLDDLKDFEGKVEGWRRSEILASRLQDILVELDIAGLVIHELTKDGMKKPSMRGIAGGKKVAYRAVCAVQLLSHIPLKGEEAEENFRTVQSIKAPRLVEGYSKYADLFKDPLYPRFGLAERKAKDVDLHWSG
jgi:replicative DNA helicase